MVAEIAGTEWVPWVVKSIDGDLVIENYPRAGRRGSARLGDTVIVGEFEAAYVGSLAAVSLIPDMTITSLLLFVTDGWSFTVEPDAEDLAVARITPAATPRAEMF